MSQLQVFYFEGKNICTELSDLINIFNYRLNNCNYIELNDGYPFMIILINGCFACAMYYENEFDGGHYAYINDHFIDENDSTMFYMGTSKNPTETLISNKLVIPVSTAKAIVEEFFISKKMLNTVNWFDL